MEGSSSSRKEKRRRDDDDDDDNSPTRAPNQQKIPAFGRVVLEALKMDGLQKLCFYLEPFIRRTLHEELRSHNDTRKLEPLLRKIISEELQRLPKPNIPDNLVGGGSLVAPRLMSSPPRGEESGGRKLQLRFEAKMPSRLFTGRKVKGEGGLPINVILVDLSDDSVVKTGPESAAKLNIVVLQGDFDEESWTHEIFQSNKVKVRDGRGPLLIGVVQLTLKGGVGTLGELSFTDNSSWTRSKKFRLGVEMAPGFCQEICVMEAKTDAFAVKDQRGDQKHYPPVFLDEVWRVEGIAKDGPLHKRLVRDGIRNVEDLLRLHAKDPQRLRTILGNRMTDKMWTTAITHAKTCDFSDGKLYVFYVDEIGVIFNHIHELTTLITDGKVVPLESLAPTLKVSSLAKMAYENWHQVIEYKDDVLRPFTAINEVEAHPPEQARSIDHQYVNYEHIPLQPNYIFDPPQILEQHPSLRSDQNFELPFSNPETGFAGNTLYTSAETSGVGFPSEDWWLQENIGTGWENCFREVVPITGDEMLEHTKFDEGDGVGEYGLGGSLSHAYSVEDEAVYNEVSEAERGNRPGRTVVGWLKIKAAFKWGIMVRNRAAERKAQLIELD